VKAFIAVASLLFLNGNGHIERREIVPAFRTIYTTVNKPDRHIVLYSKFINIRYIANDINRFSPIFYGVNISLIHRELKRLIERSIFTSPDFGKWLFCGSSVNWFRRWVCTDASSSPKLDTVGDGRSFISDYHVQTRFLADCEIVDLGGYQANVGPQLKPSIRLSSGRQGEGPVCLACLFKAIGDGDARRVVTIDMSPNEGVLSRCMGFGKRACVVDLSLAARLPSLAESQKSEHNGGKHKYYCKYFSRGFVALCGFLLFFSSFKLISYAVKRVDYLHVVLVLLSFPLFCAGAWAIFLAFPNLGQLLG
jgi:hypothetical protein